MMKKIYLMTLLALLSLFSACMRDTEDCLSVLPDGAKAVVLKLSVPANTAVRATEEGDKDGDLNENKVERIDLFFFKPDGSLFTIPKNVRRSELELTVIIPAGEISGYQNQTFDIVAVANASETELTGVQNLNDLKTRIYTSSFNPNPAAAQSAFLMDGTISSGTITWAAQEVVYKVPNELPLHRAAAKVRLRIRKIEVKQKANGETVSYQLEGDPQVKLINYVNKTSIIAGSPYAVQPNDFLDTEYRPMTWRAYDQFTNDLQSGDKKHQFLSAAIPFYSYENDWSNQADNETYLMVKLMLKSGDLAAKPFYYRIPINYRYPTSSMTEEQKNGLHKLQRNHLYDVVSTIEQLGSEDERDPLPLDAFVAVQPWYEEKEPIDGDIKNAHYLVVKNKTPLMPNQNRIEVEFVSDLPIQIKINKTSFTGYKVDGTEDHHTQINSGDFKDIAEFDNVKVSTNLANPDKKTLIIEHPLPNNYVPFDFDFTIQHVMPQGETGTPLKQGVQVIQYPPKYVTGEKSPGYRPNPGETHNADFRFHDLLGVINTYPGESSPRAQQNDVFFKVTTLVNVGEERIGDPTGGTEYTLRDEAHNRMISPEFIVASQHGLAASNLSQYNGGGTISNQPQFAAGFGPYSSRFEAKVPYYRPGTYSYDHYTSPQPVFRNYHNAQDRCYNYFEGEYGTDGDYVEYYFTGSYSYSWSHRSVKKKFKYQGRWRIPTAAELEYIDKIQDDGNSAIKSLLFGNSYWTAQTGKAYSFTGNQLFDSNASGVRCVFDTYKHKNKK